jgi:N-acetylglucosaminyl-diphospho-decaprenol L-rhamnosyltransferase
VSAGAGADIAVIIVNYGTAELTVDAVESVRARRHGGRRVEIHVVDNASPGGDGARLAEAHRARGWGETVTLHLEEVNHGFGRGNNVVLSALAAREVRPAYAFLLNPDARLENEALDILASFLETHPTAGAAGSAIFHPDGRAATAAFRFPSLWSELERAAGFGPVSRLLGRHRTALPPDLPAQPVDWVSGAAVMLRWRALEEAGFFDPAYFLYFEEVDLMRALKRAGWQTWYVPEARVVHEEGAATGVGTKMARKRRPPYVYESWRHYFRKNHGTVVALAGAALLILGGALHVVTSRLMGREPWTPLNYMGDVGRHVVRPLLLGERPSQRDASRVRMKRPRDEVTSLGEMISAANRIGDNCVIILQNATFGIAALDKPQARPVIGDRVQIGSGARRAWRGCCSIWSRLRMSEVVGAVVIGRNEGERLLRCLASVGPDVDRAVYVDSGSTDGSLAAARAAGFEVVELDVTLPFTAARARNAGLARLREGGRPTTCSSSTGTARCSPSGSRRRRLSRRAAPRGDRLRAAARALSRS